MGERRNGDGRLLEWGAASESRPGQTVAGDRAVVNARPDGAVVAAIDGLGHGPEAARAARIVSEVVGHYRDDDLTALLARCHGALTHTRGAAISLAFLSAGTSTITWLGIGSVEGRLLSGDRSAPRPKESLRLVSGVPGHRLPAVRPATLELRRGDILIFATDGIEASFADSLTLSGSPETIAERILANHWKITDDALALVLRYLG
ncbi:MAG: SpoIIE family protein phosphatase, partial [Actinobacteria bacterium]|nr:SpoIIE family protein phosphatase [Actinomycetota bacterium]